MKKYILMLIMGISLQIHAQRCVYQKVDSVKIVTMLQKAVDNHKNKTPLFFAHQLIGRPYVAHTLEGQPTERLVVNTRQLDCTTLVETVTALTICAKNKQTSFDAYCSMLEKLRYHHHKINGYTSRLHYFTDWILSNGKAGWVKEIQSNNTPFTAVQNVRVGYMSAHPLSYVALKNNPEDVKVIAAQERKLTGQTFSYIPNKQITNSKILRQTIHDGDIIAIVTNKKGLDISHVGFAEWKSDGLHLLNASMIHKKVVLEPMTLAQYMKKHPSFLGIRVIRIK